MKLALLLLPLCFLAGTGCQSTFGPELGMTEKSWLRRTLVADLVYMEQGVKAYRSGGVYYYFVDGKLARIDQGRLPPQEVKVQLTVESK
jgi:hypothetical protein